LILNNSIIYTLVFLKFGVLIILLFLKLSLGFINLAD